MTRDEIIGWASVSRDGLVLECDASEYAGYLRRVVLRGDRRGAHVRIEYERFGFDEGGIYFHGDFASFDEAIASLEDYLGRPSTAWRPVREQDEAPGPEDTRESWQRLVDDARNGRIRLPRGPFRASVPGTSEQPARE